MDCNEYIAQVEAHSKKLSAVKRSILGRLWEEGDSFPRGWVASSILLELTGQKYFDRRTRELRDENGCDIETEHVNGEHSYRLNSLTLGTANTRLYLSEKEKKALFEASSYTCATCGVVLGAGMKGLQADHKKPLIRGGSHESSNWQAMCNVCNVGKRRACADCEEDCEQCPWAYPEKFGVMTMLPIPQETYSKLVEKFGAEKGAVSEGIVAILNEKLSS